MTGKVKWFNTDRHFGIIEQDNGRKDVFVHWKDIEGIVDAEGVSEGLSVSFDVIEEGGDRKAINVRQLDVHVSVALSRSLRNHVDEAAQLEGVDFTSAVHLALDAWANRVLAQERDYSSESSNT